VNGFDRHFEMDMTRRSRSKRRAIFGTSEKIRKNAEKCLKSRVWIVLHPCEREEESALTRFLFGPPGRSTTGRYRDLTIIMMNSAACVALIIM